MATRYSVVFRFSPDSLTWLVRREGAVLSRWCRKRDAVAEAARLARGDAPSTLTIGGMDGDDPGGSGAHRLRRYDRPSGRDLGRADGTRAQ
ncbi:DUF2188 domain-containing protein [Saccharomonospora iraqiensis]|uniref:DUF2188 domain-containing protein n=1 Tax=Saccharomonospora iraqiensis TaxID=52698 RepID=UPI00022E7532|nr:DUF2188 domain-containing protein [Saccharomonospora iraqiensis]